MSDPQNPSAPLPPDGSAPLPPPAYDPPPAASAPPGQPYPGQPYPGQPYESAPPAAYGAPASAAVPGKTLGIVAFVLSFFAQLIALILGIVALVQSKRAGHKNGWAVAAIWISAVLMVIGLIIGIVVLAVAIPAGMELARQCAELGPGVHTLPSGITITCGSS